MKLSEGVEWAAHCCSILAALPDGEALNARDLAEFFDLPPGYLAKQMQRLAAANVVEAVRGRSGGYRLARAPETITLLEIVEAVEGAEPSFRCTQIRQRGPSAVEGARYPRPCGIAVAMWRADAAWRRELATVTLAELARRGQAETPDAQIARAAAWFEEKLK